MTHDLTSGNRGSPIWLQGPAGSHYSLVPQGDWDPAYSRGYSNKQAGNQPHLSQYWMADTKNPLQRIQARQFSSFFLTTLIVIMPYHSSISKHSRL